MKIPLKYNWIPLKYNEQPLKYPWNTLGQFKNNANQIEKDKVLEEFEDFPYVDELKFIIETTKQEQLLSFDKSIVTAKIVRHGYLNLLKYYIKKDYILSDIVCKIAAYENDFEIFKIAHDHGAKITDKPEIKLLNNENVGDWSNYVSSLKQRKIGADLASYGNLNFLNLLTFKTPTFIYNF